MSEGLSEAILERIAGRSARTIELNLERLPAVLERLGQPHRRLPPVIHLAGTNGKGSTLAFLRAMLQHAGKRVQCFSSPYLLRLTEEIELSSGEISDTRLADLLTRVEDASEDIGLTAFEALAAAAFLAFAEDEADVLLLETAMGGRFDVTNVVPPPRVSVITPIALDHMAFLGGTIAEIAGHKAGILKPGTICVANPQHPEAITVVRRQAEKLDVPLQLYGEDFRLEGELPKFLGQSAFDVPMLSLPGPHQRDNAALALAALAAFGPDLLPGAAEGLASADWPARMQRLPGTDPDVWADGGHNPHAAAVMAEALAELPPRELVLVVAMLDTRPLEPFLDAFRRFRPFVIGVPLPGKPVYSPGQGMTPERIAATAREMGFNALVAASAIEALEMMPGDGGETRVLITGSLYLAGRAARDLAG